jgi:hypothetical protein
VHCKIKHLGKTKPWIQRSVLLKLKGSRWWIKVPQRAVFRYVVSGHCSGCTNYHIPCRFKFWSGFKTRRSFSIFPCCYQFLVIYQRLSALKVRQVGMCLKESWNCTDEGCSFMYSSVHSWHSNAFMCLWWYSYILLILFLDNLIFCIVLHSYHICLSWCSIRPRVQSFSVSFSSETLLFS